MRAQMLFKFIRVSARKDWNKNLKVVHIKGEGTDLKKYVLFTIQSRSNLWTVTNKVDKFDDWLQYKLCQDN